MSRSAKVTLPFAGEKRVFRLAIPQLEELQERCNAGPRVILSRIQTGSWKTYDIRDTLRLSLIGGGMKDREAMLLVDRYASEGQLQENEDIATSILLAALVGSPDGDGEETEDPQSGEMTGEAKAATDSPTAS